LSDTSDAARKEKKRLYMAGWRAKNAEHKKSYAKQYYAENRDERIAYTKQWKSENKEWVRERRAAYRALEENKLKEKQAYDKWRAANIDKDKAKTKAYRDGNVERILARNQNRRALLSGGKLSLGIASALLARQKSKCACCRVDLKKVGHHLDHIVPLSKGGVNEDSNIQLLCPTCNLSKGAKCPIEFMNSRGFLI
jgi:5-methylcytosine-specific restriction endonuclease McrA